MEYLDKIAEVDVIVVGAGPAELTAGYYLARKGLKTLIIEKRISFGGGIGRGMLFPRIVLAKPPDEILRDIKCKYEETSDNVLIVDPAELIAKLATAAVDAGANILLGVTVDDVIYRESPCV